MAALLRHGAARRLGGSMVRRAEAVVADGRRRLGPRLMHTEEQAHAELARECQQKKEELYDVIAEGQQYVYTSSFRNKLLLQHLAVQVKERPQDSKWRRMRFFRKANTMLQTAGLVALTGMENQRLMGKEPNFSNQIQEVFCVYRLPTTGVHLLDCIA